MSRQYYAVESLNLSAQQRMTLVNTLQQLGNNQHAMPSHRNHWRMRGDNLALIFEADFDDDDWTVNTIKNRLASLFGVAVSTVTSGVQQTAYGPVVTFGRGGDRLRLVAFGGLLATWEESHDAVLAYLSANSEAWDA